MPPMLPPTPSKPSPPLTTPPPPDMETADGGPALDLASATIAFSLKSRMARATAVAGAKAHAKNARLIDKTSKKSGVFSPSSSSSSSSAFASAANRLLPGATTPNAADAIASLLLYSNGSLPYSKSSPLTIFKQSSNAKICENAYSETNSPRIALINGSNAVRSVPAALVSGRNAYGSVNIDSHTSLQILNAT